MTQVVSRQSLTAAAWFCGFVEDKVALGQVFVQDL
jgi:hypothetical protein